LLLRQGTVADQLSKVPQTDGKSLVEIISIFQKDGRYFAEVDFVQFITDNRSDGVNYAAIACVEDEECCFDKDPECVEDTIRGGMPNGFHVRNHDKNRYIFPISHDVAVEVIVYDKDGGKHIAINLEDFIKIQFADGYLRDLPNDSLPLFLPMYLHILEFSDSEIIKIKARYTP
jgi:hypothetical protein